MIFMAGRIFGMVNRRNRGYGMRRQSTGWGSRHNTRSGQGLSGLSSLLGLGRRRRSFI